jgi:hypothetical protein
MPVRVAMGKLDEHTGGTNQYGLYVAGPDGSTIIDGTSNVYKIAATGTQSVTEATGDAAAQNDVTLTVLGALAAVPTHFATVTDALAATQYRLVARILNEVSMFAASISGGSPTFKFTATVANAYALCSLNGSNEAVSTLFLVNRSGSSKTYYSRYVIFQEASI